MAVVSVRSVVVRRAGARDVAVLEALASAASGTGRAEAVPVPAQRAQREPSERGARLAALLAHPDVEVHLAEAGGEAVGLLVLRRGEVVLPAPAPVVHVEQLWVDPAWRRRGVGHQLLAATVAAAEAVGAEEVSAVSGPGERDAQRFLARLGFARPAVLRSAPLQVLRARLVTATAPTASGRVRRRAALDQLVARRRRQLDRAPEAALSDQVPGRVPGQVSGGLPEDLLSEAGRPAAGT